MARTHSCPMQKSWTSIPASEFSITGDATNASGGLSVGSSTTILRCRGFVQAMFDASAQVGDNIFLTFGLGIVSSDAFAVGPGSLPDPSGDAGYPWLWWTQMILQAETTTPISSWGPHA